MSEPKIYVACLASYNNGYLHGAWIDATQDIDDIWQQIKTILASSPIEDAEEYAIHDFEGFAGYQLSKYEGIETAHHIASFIEEHGEIAGDLLNYFGGDLDDATKAIEEHYCGCYSSLEITRRNLQSKPLKSHSI